MDKFAEFVRWSNPINAVRNIKLRMRVNLRILSPMGAAFQSSLI